MLSYLEKSNMIEISELISEIEEKFGVSAVTPVAVAGAPGGTEQVAEAKTEFDLILNKYIFINSVNDKNYNLLKQHE